jgi:hypothetical protein
VLLEVGEQEEYGLALSDRPLHETLVYIEKQKSVNGPHACLNVIFIY